MTLDERINMVCKVNLFAVKCNNVFKIFIWNFRTQYSHVRINFDINFDIVRNTLFSLLFIMA